MSDDKFRITFKPGVDIKDFKWLTRQCEILFVAAMRYCHEHKLPMRITSMVSDRKDVVSKSSTHQEGRAFDLSVHGWEKDNIIDFVEWMNHNYKNIAAISSHDLVPRAAIYHNTGNGYHIHCQVRRDRFRNQGGDND